MALKIRLRQQGRKNRTLYRLVLSDARSPRDGKYLETLGWYNPLESEPEKHVHVHSERILHWIKQGAIFTEKAQQLVQRAAPEVIDEVRKQQLEARAKVRIKKRAGRKNKAQVSAA